MDYRRISLERFSDFADEDKPLDGEKRKLEQVLNMELVVTGERIRESKYREEGRRRYAQIQVELKGKRYVVFTGSEVLIGQLEKYRDHIPFVATVKKIDRYYTFS
jgi:hypothetical protein